MKEKSYSKAYKKNIGKIKTTIIILAVFALLIGGLMTFWILKETVLAPQISEISDLKYGKIGKIVKVTTDRYYYTGYVDKQDNKEVASYYYVAIGDVDEYVIVRGKKAYYNDEWGKVRTFTGKVEYDPYHSEDIERFAEAAEMDVDDVEDILLDIQINEKYEKGYFSLLIIPLGLIFMIWIFYYYGIKGGKKHQDRLAKFVDLEKADAGVIQDMENDRFVNFRRLSISRNWIYSTFLSNFYLYPSSEIVWVYELITSHYTNGVPSGKTFQCKFFLTDGTELAYNGSKKVIDEIIDFAANNWLAYVGYNDEFKLAIKRDTEDFVEKWKENRGIK